MEKKLTALTLLPMSKRCRSPNLKEEGTIKSFAMDSSLVVSFHLQAIDQTAAIKDIKHKLTALDQMTVVLQGNALRLLHVQIQLMVVVRRVHHQQCRQEEALVAVRRRRSLCRSRRRNCVKTVQKRCTTA